MLENVNYWGGNKLEEKNLDETRQQERNKKLTNMNRKKKSQNKMVEIGTFIAIYITVNGLNWLKYRKHHTGELNKNLVAIYKIH